MRARLRAVVTCHLQADVAELLARPEAAAGGRERRQGSASATAVTRLGVNRTLPQGQSAATHTAAPLDGMSLASVARSLRRREDHDGGRPLESVGPAPPVTSAPLTGLRLPLSS